MYIELFIADDLLLNLLILRLAAALNSERPPLLRMSAAALSASLVSAASAFLWPILRSPLFKLPLLALMTLGLPFRSMRGFLKNMSALLFSTFVAGGCAVVVALMTGGGVKNGFIEGGVPLRAALASALAVSFLPSAARRILRRRLKNETTAEAVLLHNGVLLRYTALVDTGNSLSEPISGLPVAVVRGKELKCFAGIPVPAETVTGRTVLMGFKPEHFSVNGREVDCIVAVTDKKLSAEAIIPPELVA